MNKIMILKDKFWIFKNNSKILKFKLLFFSNKSNIDNIINKSDSLLNVYEIQNYQKNKNRYNISSTYFNNLIKDPKLSLEIYNVQKLYLSFNIISKILKSYSYELFKLVYKIDKMPKRIKIFGENFVNNNKNKYSL